MAEKWEEICTTPAARNCWA